jgi:AbiV family abortive infection protein
MNFEEASSLRLACLGHAKELLDEADKLLQTSPHLSFHLATLALEEIGKSVQAFIEINHVPHPSDNTPRFLNKDDHVQKLFWALWSPSSNTETMSPEHMKWCQDFARKTHELRLNGLYVDWKDGKISVPRDTVTQKQANQLVDLARTRLNLSNLEQMSELDDERKSLLQWFSRMVWDEEQARRLFTKASLSKLIEFSNFPDWINWLKADSEKADQEAKEILSKELQRTEPQDEARGKPKWKVKIRFFTTSHSVRQPELNWVNQMGDLIRLDRGKDSKELFLTMALPSAIPLQGLWHVGWLESRRFVVALNIGSLGYFWWQIPTDVSKYHVKMFDLETNYEVKVERVPRLTLDWGNRVLDQTALLQTLLSYRFLPRGTETAEPSLLVNYLNGLAFLGKNDIHLRMESSALVSFYQAFRIALQHYKDWDGESDFGVSCTAMFAHEFPDMADWVEILDLAKCIQNTTPPPKEITLTHAIGMKLYCDSYILKKLKSLADQERNNAEATTLTNPANGNPITDSKPVPPTPAK